MDIDEDNNNWDGYDIWLSEIKIESLEKEIVKLKEENEKIMNELLEERNNVYDWKEKYKELKR